MKIIGTTPNGFLVDVSKNEVANLIGFYSSYDNDFNRQGINVGSEILISDMYEKLYHLAQFKTEMYRIAVTLRGFADHLELQPPILEPKKDNPIEGEG